MKRHSLDDESTHPGSLIAGSRLPPKRGLTWPGSSLVPSYSVESDYAPGPWSAAAAAADEAAALEAELEADLADGGGGDAAAADDADLDAELDAELNQ